MKNKKVLFITLIITVLALVGAIIYLVVPRYKTITIKTAPVIEDTTKPGIQAEKERIDELINENPEITGECINSNTRYIANLKFEIENRTLFVTLNGIKYETIYDDINCSYNFRAYQDGSFMYLIFERDNGKRIYFHKSSFYEYDLEALKNDLTLK